MFQSNWKWECGPYGTDRSNLSPVSRFYGFFSWCWQRLTTKTKTMQNSVQAWQVSICHWVVEKSPDVTCLALFLSHASERTPCKAKDFFSLFLSLVAMKGEKHISNPRNIPCSLSQEQYKNICSLYKICKLSWKQAVQFWTTMSGKKT